MAIGTLQVLHSDDIVKQKMPTYYFMSGEFFFTLEHFTKREVIKSGTSQPQGTHLVA